MITTFGCRMIKLLFLIKIKDYVIFHILLTKYVINCENIKLFIFINNDIFFSHKTIGHYTHQGTI